MIAENPHPWAMRLLSMAAVVGMGGWLVLMILFGWWTLEPARLPVVTEPIPVINPDDEVAVGDTLLMQLSVVKTYEATPVQSARWLACDSGNLVTLTASPIRLPVGTYDILSDSIVIPAKIAPGDVCRATIAVTWEINPIRTESSEFTSEPFLVLPDRKAG